MATTHTHSPSVASFSYQHNHIDLTSDDDDDEIDSRFSKRPRIDPPRVPPSNNYPMAIPSAASLRSPSHFQPYAPSHLNPNAYRPPFAPAQPVFSPARQYPPPPPPRVSSAVPAQSRVIDLTGSPSPPPSMMAPPPSMVPPPSMMQQPLPSLPAELSPKTPVCIGQLGVTALVLYPVPYLLPTNPMQEEWALVHLQYEHKPDKPGGAETIHIKTRQGRSPTGEQLFGEAFGVVEQKVATALGPMLGKALIRLEAKVRKGPPNLPILPLQMLVSTPKGNIPIVGKYLRDCGLLLDHPSPPYEIHRLQHYWNPHNPPLGGHRANNRLYPPVNNAGRWSTQQVAGKSVEVQRSQVDELFKSLKGGDELAETEAGPEVATKLYPHQKKALTFLLEREREKPGADGKFSSLWQMRTNNMTHRPCWFHTITTKEIFHEPKETKGAILADDMGLGKTITCVSLIAATLASARQFAASPPDVLEPPAGGSGGSEPLSASHFSGSVWNMPEDTGSMSGKAKAKAARAQDKLEAEHARVSRIKAKSRASLIICPLSTVSNWEDQFRDHWRGEVQVVGGAGGCMPSSSHSTFDDSSRRGTPLRVYIYHGTARKPDPNYLADFDAVITTYATLASEYSKQNKSVASLEADEEDDDGGSSDGGGVEVDERGNQILKLPKPKKKRKKSFMNSAGGISSALQSIHWFRVVLDEAHCIKETGTVGSRACCDLMADRRLCLTGTPVQNKLDDVFALIKFLRLDPLDDKNVWTEYIGSPVKFGQAVGFARVQMIMKCITLRRTKESKTQDGTRILDLPPRRDELRYLRFDEQEKTIYDQFFNESKAEFDELTDKNEVMKNYVGILQKILRLRQICDHYELVEGKGPGQQQDSAASYEDIVADISRDGINASRAAAVFAILRESATTQCGECGTELCLASDLSQADVMDVDGPSAPKRARKAKGSSSSRGPTRANSPSTPRPVMTRCQHLFCIECYRACVCPGWPNVPPETRRACSACSNGLSPSDAVEIKPDNGNESTAKKKPAKKEKRQKGLSLENFHPSTKIKALLGDLVQFSRANPHSANYDSDSIEVQMVDNQGNQLDDGVVKTVVFSQWTSMLDKIEDALEDAGIRYDRLDGTMKRDDRTRAMEALKHDPACEVLLVSLKAGGVGLNLTAAQRVYLMDPYWQVPRLDRPSILADQLSRNPAVENQAVDRIHRLGQTRPVTTVKLIIENTIEARLLEVQRKKTALANMTLGQNFSKAEMMSRRMEELNELFG
ncbi:SNF2 family N-terminal domain-containing protein [Roridomyces roridus]|uniref:SNF2 family N-terminal domain-containing protein n=1 Tax=Roridomyces roridus TaxID=1738132 RepID=A0AAD7BU09_9AGAR|nr:SNF2 family N-terminal domain-containing protein [Roridomyces roridus]